MRGRFRRLRQRSMASRRGEDGAVALSPQAMRVAGWLAVILLIAAIALAVRILGGNADGTSVVPSPSASSGAVLPITFGTELDGTTGEVTEASRTDRFVAGDTFAYSVATAAPPPEVVVVVVERTGGGVEEVVQSAAEGEQRLPADRLAIAFMVPADILIREFGPGTYRMRIHLEPEEAPLAQGTFELVVPAAPSPSG